MDGYHQPPLALVGQNGVGRSFVALWIARNAGVPLIRVPVGTDFRNEPSTRHDVERRVPLLPVFSIASARCEKPVIVLELDVDKPILDEVEDTRTDELAPETKRIAADQRGMK